MAKLCANCGNKCGFIGDWELGDKVIVCYDCMNYIIKKNGEEGLSRNLPKHMHNLSFPEFQELYRNPQLASKYNTEIVEVKKIATSALNPTKKIAGIQFNDVTEEISFGMVSFLGDFFEADDFGEVPSKFSYASLVKYEYKENEKIITQGGSGVGRAIVGGVLFGGAGAIVGAITKKNHSSSVISDMSVWLTFDVNGKIYIKKAKINEFMDDDIKYGSHTYMKYLSIAEEALSKVEDIYIKYHPKEDISEESDGREISKNVSGADEIRKYKQLWDDGIISETEYHLKKIQILGINLEREQNFSENQQEENKKIKKITPRECQEIVSGKFYSNTSENIKQAIDILTKFVSEKNMYPNDDYKNTMKFLAQITCNNGANLLYEAVNKSNRILVEELLRFGADVNVECKYIQKNRRNTPLDISHYALWKFFENEEVEKIYELLLTKGAKRKHDLFFNEEYKDISEYNSPGRLIQKVCNVLWGKQKDFHLNYGERLNEVNCKCYLNAKKEFCIPKNEDVYVIINEALRKNCRKGFAICRTGIYFSNGETRKLEWIDVRNLSEHQMNVYLNMFSITEKIKYLNLFKYLCVALKYDNMEEKLLKSKENEYQFCAFCGKKILRSAKFCNYCGRSKNIGGEHEV